MASSEPQAPPIRKDGLQVEEDRHFQRRFWIIERWAWLAFGLIAVAALAGLSGGGGYFGHTTITTASAMLEVPRITRWQRPDDITVTFNTANDTHRVVMGLPFVENFSIEQIQPQPERSYLTTDGQAIEFAAEGSAPHVAVLHVRAHRPGMARYVIEVDGEPAEWALVVLP